MKLMKDMKSMKKGSEFFFMTFMFFMGGMSACGPRAERVREPRRAQALGVGPQRI